ncbi:PREDICTED: kininogen-1 isoform X3 [Sturnus vulgaris]|uniref:kininogen-1 isoform X3 n=1 Tax=Sturnus vulgaris TaxID=9172 RepID=UPI00071A8041|nr:PREDICTED: kininogen-1 isoform X3 [Sturnus vulgaris]
MKAFIVLALCCSFFSSKAIPLAFEFSDCDDPDVFKAVDAALKKYNGETATGNQFALYVVMEAKRTAGPDPELYVKYRILESTCAAEENKHWQHCHYKVSAEAKTGECTARVHMNDADKTTNVSQECKIFSDVSKIRLTEAPCLGCFHHISSDGSEVSEILKKAIRKFNKHSDEHALFKLVEIKEAKRQVVAGWNYIIRYDMEETNCSKDQFQDLTPECKITSRGRVAKCEAKAFQNLQAEIVDTISDCKLPVEETVAAATCPGCPRTIPNDSPELKEPLKVSIEKYNSESSDDFYYKGGEIQSATVQVVAGKKYQVKFTVWKTNCSKSEFEKLNEDCTATSNSATLSCKAEIYVIPWEDKIYPQVNCTEEQEAFFFARRPPGFTPFRSTPGFTPFRSTMMMLSQPHEASTADQNEGESQSSTTEKRKDDGQEPEDRSESPRPRCPGKPWKQLVGFPAPPSFPREFTNEDLLPSAAENIDPATENKEDFNLTDALA